MRSLKLEDAKAQTYARFMTLLRLVISAKTTLSFPLLSTRFKDPAAF